MTIGYTTAIGINWPTVQCHASGPAYEDLIWDAGDAIPSQEVLDAWISTYVAPNAASSTRITNLAFRNRFTMAEKVTIELASLDNPAASSGSRQLAASLRVYLRDLDNARFIDLARSDTAYGVEVLAQYGLIAAGRDVQILTTAPTSIELYQGG